MHHITHNTIKIDHLNFQNYDSILMHNTDADKFLINNFNCFNAQRPSFKKFDNFLYFVYFDGCSLLNYFSVIIFTNT